MLKLNLIPPYILEARRVRKLLILCIVLVVVEVAALAGWFFYLSQTLTRLQGDFQELQAQAQQVQNIVQAKNGIVQRMGPMKQKVEFMEKLETFNAIWADTIEGLNEYIYAGVQITSLQLTPTSVQLQGLTRTTDDVGRFYLNFKRCPLVNPDTVRLSVGGAPGGMMGGAMSIAAPGGMGMGMPEAPMMGSMMPPAGMGGGTQQRGPQFIQVGISAMLAQPIAIPTYGGAPPPGAGGMGMGGIPGLPGAPPMGEPPGMPMAAGVSPGGPGGAPPESGPIED